MTDLKTFVSLDDLAKFADDKFVQMLKENKVKDILKAIGLFSDQTITNDILIISQNPEATVVKRLSDWGYYKRKVKENQKGIKVISHVLKNYNIDTTDENGNVTVVHCTYDPASRGGNSPDGRKVKGTIHWVSAACAKDAEVRLYENLVDEEKGVYDKETGELNLNPNSLVIKKCYVEDNFADCKGFHLRYR